MKRKDKYDYFFEAVRQVRNGATKDDEFLKKLIKMSGYTYDDVVKYNGKQPNLRT